ncbi:hypothetical protein QBC41DRAFT_16200 [Cercophora samala]|uniref:Uncharacterized protein n=1 Tax=Cercophora samala TaxID=330535 RepID=A0AA39Z6S7_9PEZI|nr:hypothetical protein QBC41DRAFT_16200 [Cercophora samala]
MSASSASDAGSGAPIDEKKADEQQPSNNNTGDGTSLEPDVEDKAAVPVQNKVLVPGQQPDVQDEAVVPQPAPITPFRKLSQYQQDQANAEHAHDVIFSYFIRDWDASKHWTSINRVYSWYDPFTKDKKRPTATFTYTSRSDATEFAILDALQVHMNSPLRQMIRHRDKKHGAEVTYHVHVKAFVRTGTFGIRLSEEEIDVMGRYAWKLTDEKDKRISDVNILVVGGAPFRRFELLDDPWANSSFASPLWNEEEGPRSALVEIR